MTVKNKKTGIKGSSSTFNIHALAEIIVWFSDGECSSEYIKDYDVYLKKTKTWHDMQDAFQKKLIIPDNFNRAFREPVDEIEKERGWY